MALLPLADTLGSLQASNEVIALENWNLGRLLFSQTPLTPTVSETIAALPASRLVGFNAHSIKLFRPSCAGSARFPPHGGFFSWIR